MHHLHKGSLHDPGFRFRSNRVISGNAAKVGIIAA
jgi:hypothetical protein